MKKKIKSTLCFLLLLTIGFIIGLIIKSISVVLDIVLTGLGILILVIIFIVSLK